jgi:hypothetical protein
MTTLTLGQIMKEKADEDALAAAEVARRNEEAAAARFDAARKAAIALFDQLKRQIDESVRASGKFPEIRLLSQIYGTGTETLLGLGRTGTRIDYRDHPHHVVWSTFAGWAKEQGLCVGLSFLSADDPDVLVEESYHKLYGYPG